MVLRSHPILILLIFLIYLVSQGPDAFEDWLEEIKTAPKDDSQSLPPGKVNLPQNTRIAGNFTSAKRKGMRVYAENRTTFYCGCDFDENKRVNPTACGYVVKANEERGARRVGTRHAGSAVRQTDGLLERRREIQLQKDEQGLRQMENDLHNLVPAVGELNGDRFDYAPAIIPGERREYGACDFEVDSRYSVAEPAAHLRGDVARMYFYMAYTYGVSLTPTEITRFSDWNETDPVDKWELQRNERIFKEQGNRNPYVVPAA